MRLALLTGPARLAPAGLVNVQHRHRTRVGQYRLGVGDERCVRGRPGHPRTLSGFGDRAGRLADVSADLGAQSCGVAPARRYLRDRFREADFRAGVIAAAVAGLVPPQHDRNVPVLDVARVGDGAFPSLTPFPSPDSVRHPDRR